MKKPSVSRSFTMASPWLAVCVFLMFTSSLGLYVWTEREIDRANELRLKSFELATELRQTTDQLTNLVRAFVVTGDAVYKLRYQEMVAIRDGSTPRPQRLPFAFWNGEPLNDEAAAQRGPSIALLELMRRANFTGPEFEKLAEAKVNADVLDHTERNAIAITELGAGASAADRLSAIRMLFGDQYDQEEASILRPIDDFQQMADQRTQALIGAAKTDAAWVRGAFFLFGILLVALIWEARRALHSTLGASVKELHARIASLGRGDLAPIAPVAADKKESVMGWLVETQSNLAKIDGERRQAERHNYYLAHFDSLTGLPNRTQLAEIAKQSIMRAQAGGPQFALMLLDLDHFKDVNDSLGHNIGDALLIELADRLRVAFRGNDMVARFGGDEFVFLLHGASGQDGARMAQKVLDIIAIPFCVEQFDLNLSGSIGIAVYPVDGDSLDTLSKNADVAMHSVKRDGRQAYRFFVPSMQAHSLRNLQIVNGLRVALERRQLHLCYQPQVSLRDGRIVGAEALLRWQHPELGVVSPAEFIPIAEESGLIHPIGEWVLRSALRQACIWKTVSAVPLVMSVNLSPVQFLHHDLPGLVSRLLEESAFPPERLELELTESVAMQDPQRAIATVHQLDERGVRVCIDDFGTGYSSLSQLKKFKFHKLKIDQSFVRDINTDSDDRNIVCAIINLAKSFGLATIAEGVETAAQQAFLEAQGCDEAQGYYYSKPLLNEQFVKFLTAGSGEILGC